MIQAKSSGYLFGLSYRGSGFGTEAKRLLLEDCFNRLHLRAICSHVWEPNARLAAALLKQGYRPAGRLKWEDHQDGVFREDWLAARAAWRAGPAGATADEDGD